MTGSTVLDIGCGTRKIEAEAVGIDIAPGSSADIIWDLDRYPWPLESGRFTRIHMSHVIEHFGDIMRAMAEVHRVARAGADVYVTTPHFSSHNSFTDPTHKTHLAARSFEYFTGRAFESFTGSAFSFEIAAVELSFGGNFVLDNLGRWIAGRSLAWYERHAAWWFPALDIRCHLRVVK